MNFPEKKTPGKFASTSTTNELNDAIRSLAAGDAGLGADSKATRAAITVLRMILVEDPNDDGVALCARYDGYTTGTHQIPVLIIDTSKVTDSEIFAFRVEPNTGFTYTSDGKTFDVFWSEAAGGSSGSSLIGFWATFSAHSQDGSNLRWSYTFAEIEWTGTSFADFGAKSGGKTGTAYNTLEAANGATGTFGNGVSSTNLVGTITLQPIPNGYPVWIWQETTTGDATTYRFSVPNGVDGACP